MKTYTIETAYLTLIDAQIEVLKYTDGQMALEATALQHDPDEDDSTVSEILTTNLIGYGHVAEPGHAYIKDYDLYVGLPAVLAEAGAVKIISRHSFPFGRYAYGLIPIKGVVGPWPSDVGSLLAMCLVRMRDPSALARRCSSRPLIAFDDPFDVPRRAVTRPLRRLVGQAHRVAVLRRAPSAIPAGPVVAGAGFGNVRRGLRGRVRGASQSNSWAPSVA